MRAMILVVAFLIVLPERGMAEALPDKGSRAARNTAELSDADVGLGPFADLPNVATGPENSNVVDETLNHILGPGAAEALKSNPRVQAREQACRKSKTEMQKYENCWLPFVRETYSNHPSDLVELLITRLRLAENKRIAGKISKEEADVLRAEAHVQFESESARRASLVRQEEQGRDDRELQRRMLERDIRRSELEYQQERLRSDSEARERERERFRRSLKDAYRPTTNTECSTDSMGSIRCTTR